MTDTENLPDRKYQDLYEDYQILSEEYQVLSNVCRDIYDDYQLLSEGDTFDVGLFSDSNFYFRGLFICFDEAISSGLGLYGYGDWRKVSYAKLFI